MYNRVVISSGHGLKVRGACGILDEVDEARLVTEALADELKIRGVDAVTFHDDTSTSQSQNLETIVAAHNREKRDLDISVHFNAFEQKQGPMGVEVLYLTQHDLAADLSAAIAAVGLINRGPKKRTDLYVLNQCDMPTVLLEICFVDSETDADIYRDNFDEIIANMASVIVGDDIEAMPRPPEQEASFHAAGTCSHFGGPDDMGVSASEGLAFHYEINEANQHLFLPIQPAGTTGLARRLNAKAVSYIACRWNYDVTPKKMLAESGEMALVRAPSSGREMIAYPADWGPHEEKTGRAADLSPWLMQALDISTDDEVEVIYPWKGY